MYDIVIQQVSRINLKLFRNTNLKIIDFDNVANKLSNDTTSSFFKLYMDGLEPDRYYKIQIKSIIDGGTYIYDDDYYFKVEQTV